MSRTPNDAEARRKRSIRCVCTRCGRAPGTLKREADGFVCAGTCDDQRVAETKRHFKALLSEGYTREQAMKDSVQLYEQMSEKKHA